MRLFQPERCSFTARRQEAPYKPPWGSINGLLERRPGRAARMTMTKLNRSGFAGGSNS